MDNHHIAYSTNFDYIVVMTYPLKFRRKVLSVREKEGLTISEVASRFDVGVASVVRWLKEITPKPHGHRKGKIDLQALAQDVRDDPDACHYERAARFGVCHTAIHYALRKLGVSYKKTLQHPRANDDARRLFQKTVSSYEEAGRPVIYVDESGFAHDMPRPHGYAARGHRCYGLKDWNARGEPTLSAPYRAAR